MSNRSREVETLFQRMGTTHPESHDPAIEQDAVRAVEQWPLLAMLTLGRRASAERPQAIQTPVPVAEPVQPAVEPVEEAVIAPTQRAAAPVQPAVQTPLHAAAQTELPEAAPQAPPVRPTAQLSPLEQLFLRAEQTGKAATSQPIATQPEMSQPAAAQPTSVAPLGQPPHKSPSQPRLAPLSQPPAPSAAEGPVTIEPKPRQWRELDTVPAHLFERVGAR